MADRREGGEWALVAETRAQEGIIGHIEWRPGEPGALGERESVSPSPLVFRSLASYQDFRAFWKGAGGVIDEE